ncbi:hemerythrin HHE cation binding domain-containing protein [Aspergillus pseudotamarii]|uniref:Hemerythrin HHE cation binding domain-containing protein n=1 Tax=Aspergillus pseudotamarii TaxID=132259 RepID=A0A5N6T0S0_ASPPS|nr:hemerythrin HHE cation binding domain-containing protein [Aspergillus pseudotamarii]KAE8139751.1 hemerythrin HHE cation binding domain-containing protein [Aspergillus pseudotamarii]
MYSSRYLSKAFEFPPQYCLTRTALRAERGFRTTAPAATRVSDLIKNDHRELEDAYNRILSVKTNDDKERWQNQFTWELARHSIGEELVVYPRMEKVLNNGKAMADHDRHEHQIVKEDLYKFQGLQPDDPEFIPTLKALWANLAQHIKEEETQELPALEHVLSESDSDSMARSFGRTKKFIPTRSHPAAPDKPPYETVAGLMSAPMDRLGDMLRKFPDEAKS